MGCELIPDGYTRSDDCFGLNVAYRPMPYGDFEDYMDSLISAGGENRKRLLAEMIVARIASWEATIDGEVAPVTAENYLRLPAPAGQRLRNLVTGQDSPDGKTQEEDAKNSVAA